MPGTPERRRECTPWAAEASPETAARLSQQQQKDETGPLCHTTLLFEGKRLRVNECCFLNCVACAMAAKLENANLKEIDSQS